MQVSFPTMIRGNLFYEPDRPQPYLGLNVFHNIITDNCCRAFFAGHHRGHRSSVCRCMRNGRRRHGGSWEAMSRKSSASTTPPFLGSVKRVRVSVCMRLANAYFGLGRRAPILLLMFGSKPRRASGSNGVAPPCNQRTHHLLMQRTAGAEPLGVQELVLEMAFLGGKHGSYELTSAGRYGCEDLDNQ